MDRVASGQGLCHLSLEFLAQRLAHRFCWSFVFIFVLVNSESCGLSPLLQKWIGIDCFISQYMPCPLLYPRNSWVSLWSP